MIVLVMAENNIGRGYIYCLVTVHTFAFILCEVALGLRIEKTMFIYWIAIGFSFILYNILTIFAQKESRVEQKDGRMHAAPLPIPIRSGSLKLSQKLPPIHYNNARLLPLNLVMGLGFWFFTFRLFLEYPSVDVSLSGRPDIVSIISLIGTAYSPVGLGVAIGVFSLHSYIVCRDFFGQRQYERFSAAMLAEFSGRASAFWFVALIIATIVTMVPRANGFLLLTQAIVIPMGIGGKLAVDIALIRIGRGETSGWFTKWFVPYKPTPESE